MLKLYSVLAFFITLSSLTLSANEIHELFREIKHSVVVIKVKEKQSTTTRERLMATYKGMGSGVIISAEGKVITASHVVQAANEISIELLDGQISPAYVVYSNPQADVALLQMERIPRVTSVAKLGDSDKVEIGEEIFIVGAPYGATHTLTVGHISARRNPHRISGYMVDLEYLQTDAAVNLGNSGGPMFNKKGEVIGIVSYFLSKSGGFEGIGFAVTSNIVSELLLKRKSLWSGAESYLLQGELAQALNVPQSEALLIQRVADGSPASLMGIRPGTLRSNIDGEELLIGGDIVLEVMGLKVGEINMKEIVEKLNTLEAGGKIFVTVLRNGQKKELSTIKLIDLIE